MRRFFVATALAALAALVGAPAALAQSSGYDYGDSSGTSTETTSGSSNSGTSSGSSGSSSSNGKWTVLTATLTGAAEKPGPGDSDGSGKATVKIKDDQVCWDLSWSNIDPATLAHIHKGGKTVAGPVVVTFFAKAPAVRKGCTEADQATLDRIAANPGGYYVNVHNAKFPKGAIRGQLSANSSLPFTGPGDSSQRLLWLGALITVGGAGLLIVTRRLGVGKHLATAGRHLARH